MPDAPSVPGDAGTFGQKILAHIATAIAATGGGVRDKGGQVYNVKAYGAIGNGVADDTTAFQLALDTCGAAGGGTVFVPPGTYLLNSATIGAAGGNPSCLAFSYDNVRLVGSGARSIIRNTTADISAITVAPFLIQGGLKAARVAGDQSLWYNYSVWGATGTAPTIYDLTGTYAKGAMSVTLDSEADAANFVEGDWIGIRTGQTLASFAIGQPDAEINRIKSISGAVLTLEYPLVKAYAQEYYITGTSGLTSTSVTANPAPFGVQNLTPRLLHGIVLSDFEIDNQRASAMVRGSGTVGMVFERITGRINGRSLESVGASRSHKVRFCRVHTYDAESSSAYVFTPDAGSSHGELTDNEFSSDTNPLQVHLHEGSAACRIERNKIICPSVASNIELVSIRARGYDHQIVNNEFIGGGNVTMTVIDATVTGGGLIDGNVYRNTATPVAVSLSVGALGWIVGAGNRLDGLKLSVPIGNQIVGGTVTLGPPQLETQAGSPTRTNQIGRQYWSMPNSASSSIGTNLTIPPEWAAFDLYLRWTNAGAGSGNVVWTLTVKVISDAEDITSASDVSTGSGAVAAPAQWVMKTTKLNATVIPNTADTLVQLNLTRPTGGSDTLANAAGVLEVLVRRAG